MSGKTEEEVHRLGAEKTLREIYLSIWGPIKFEQETEPLKERKPFMEKPGLGESIRGCQEEDSKGGPSSGGHKEGTGVFREVDLD